MKSEDKKTPSIIAFTCNWCSYAGADLAGVSRIQYPADVLLIRVMCTGSISPHYILKAFQKGAKAVLVAGCHPGECHYNAGNLMAEKRMKVLKGVLGFIGLPDGALHLEWISASEGIKFAEVIQKISDKVKEIDAEKV